MANSEPSILSHLEYEHQEELIISGAVYKSVLYILGLQFPIKVLENKSVVKTVKSQNGTLNHLLTHPAYLMRQEPK